MSTTATVITAVAALVSSMAFLISTLSNRRGIDKVHDAVRTSNGETIGSLIESGSAIIEAGEARRTNGDS